MVEDAVALGVDWTKIRVDSSLGQRQKMQPAVFTAVIEEAIPHYGGPCWYTLARTVDARLSLAVD